MVFGGGGCVSTNCFGFYWQYGALHGTCELNECHMCLSLSLSLSLCVSVSLSHLMPGVTYQDICCGVVKGRNDSTSSMG